MNQWQNILKIANISLSLLSHLSQISTSTGFPSHLAKQCIQEPVPISWVTTFDRSLACFDAPILQFSLEGFWSRSRASWKHSLLWKFPWMTCPAPDQTGYRCWLPVDVLRCIHVLLAWVAQNPRLPLALNMSIHASSCVSHYPHGTYTLNINHNTICAAYYIYWTCEITKTL